MRFKEPGNTELILGSLKKQFRQFFDWHKNYENVNSNSYTSKECFAAEHFELHVCIIEVTSYILRVT